MGVGHVPAGPLPQAGAGAELPRRQHRGAGTVHPDLSSARVGRLGEAIAAGFLESRGAQIQSRNMRIGGGELDLVVKLDNVRIAVEVKTSREAHDPLEQFDLSKHDQVHHLAQLAGCHRVDVIGVRLSAAGAEVRWLPAVD